MNIPNFASRHQAMRAVRCSWVSLIWDIWLGSAILSAVVCARTGNVRCPAASRTAIRETVRLVDGLGFLNGVAFMANN